MAVKVSRLSLCVKPQTSVEKEKRGEASGSYLSWHGIFTQESFIVYGKNRGVIIYVQH